MKKKNLFVSCVALSLLFSALVGCNAQGGSSAPSSKAGKPSSAVPSSAPAASSNAAPSSAAAGDDFLTVIPHTWTEGEPVKNSSDKDYIPLTDAAAGKVGVKISIQNYTLDAEGTTATGLSSDGKINPGNDHAAYLRYRVVAPKAGAYQMVLRGKSSSNALERTLDGRAFGVKLNGENVDTFGDRTPLTDTDSDFVGVPTINLTGQEDTIDITASDYRIQFDVAGFIIFAEH